MRAVAPWLLSLFLLAACGSPSATGAGNPSASSGALHVAQDADNGSTLQLRKGERLEVSLHSTYWVFNGSSNSRVLLAEGAAAVSPSPSGCVPGGGCGTVEMSFDVVGAGSADVTAARTTCGEAMMCTGNQGSYKITVIAAI